MFFSAPKRCWIARLRSGGIGWQFGRTSLRMCSRCSGLSWFHTCARSCNSCRCAGGKFCSRRLFSRTFCFSCGLRLLNSFLKGGVYADGGRFELKFGRVAVSPRFVFEFGERSAPEFCRSFCARLVSCCCCWRSCLCSCLGCCSRGGCCLGGGWLCCLGGLLSCRGCAPLALRPCAIDCTATAATHAHQLCFTGSAATRARTRTSNAADGSIIGNSSSNTFTARNSFTRNWHAAHVPRCFSISSRSPSFRRPSTYPIIFFSIRPQLMSSFPSDPVSSAAFPAAPL